MATAKSHSRPLWLRALAFALAYVASAEGSWFLSSRYGSDVIFWIPAGLIVAVLLVSERGAWPALFAAGALGNVAFDLHHATPFGVSLVYACVNVTQAGIGAFLFHRFVSHSPRLDVIREFLGLVVFSAVVSSAFMALVTSTALVFTGDSVSFAKSVVLGWSGNAMAILTVAPFVVVWSRPRAAGSGPWMAPRKVAEGAVLAAGLVAACYYLFIAGKGVLAPDNFILVPFVLWAALRFGILGASAVNFLLALVLVYFASHFPKGAGPGEAISGSYLIELYGFLATCSLVGLIPAIAIAERDRLVGQLSDSEERFRKLATAASEGVVITEDGVVTDVNDQALKLFGYDAVAQMVGLNAADFISPEAWTLVAAAVAAGEDVTYENKLTRRDGSAFHAEVQSKMMPFGDRRILMTAVRDISERKKAELLLNGQFQVLEMIAAGRPLGEILAALVRVIETQSDGMVGAVLEREGERLRLVVAPSLTETHRRSIETVEIAEGAHGCAAAAFSLKPEFIADIASDCPPSEQTRLLLGLGLRAWWSAPIVDGKQRLIGAFTLYHRQAGLPTASQRQLMDIATHTASVAMSRHRDEAALKLSDFSVNHASTPTFWVTQDSRIRRVNRAACEMTGYSEGELLAMVVPDLIQGIGREGWNDAWMETRLSRSRRFESEHTRRDGSVVLIEVDMNWFEFEGREYQFVFLHDITTRRQLEDKLRQSQKMEAIGQLSGGIAHDFNNLLTVIQGNLGIMRISGSFTQEIVELVDEIANAIDRATKLTGQLLAFGRKQVMQSADVDLNSVVDGFTRMLRRVIGEAIDLQINFSASGLPVRADSSMLEQAMLNLCLNSRDAMPGGGRFTLTTSVITVGPQAAPHSNASRAGKYALLTVTDTGIGISPENIKRVFEPFFTTKEVGKGTGLGLASVYGIIQQHNGWVSVHSELGRGTTFNIHLPLLERAAAARAPGRSSAAVPRGDETILLVEDDVSVRLVTTKALSMMGYRVLVASNGKEAIALWDAHRREIQLLLTDMVMPGGYGGAEIARIFTADEPLLKVIFMSGYSADLAGTDFSSTSGGYFLGKPFEISELASTLRSCLTGAAGAPKGGIAAMEAASLRPRAAWLKLALLGAAYWAFAEASLSLSFRSGTFATVWLPSGLYVAALIMSRPRRWPALIAVATGVNTAFDVVHGTPPVLTVTFAVLMNLQALIGAGLFRRFVTRTPKGNVMSEFLGLAVCSALCSSVPVGAANAWVLVTAGFSRSFGGSWTTSFTGDSIAILAVAPFVMIWSTPAESSRRWWRSPGRLAEASALVASMLALLLFLVRRQGIDDPYTFTLLPFVLWAAVRFGVRGASAVNLLLVVLLVSAAAHTAGSLPAGVVPQWYVATLYGFVAVSSLVGLIPALAVEERTNLLQSLGNSEERFRTLAAAAREGVVISENGIVLDANDQMLRILGKARSEVVGLPVTRMLPPGSGPEVAHRIATNQEAQYTPRILQKDGTLMELEVKAKMLQMGERNLRMTTVRDVTERKQSEILLSGQYQVLEMIAASRPLGEVLDALVRVIESQFGQLVGTVLLKDGDRLRHIAAPGMPHDFIQAIDGIRISEGEGSCGAAAFSRQPVFVRDIALDPRFVKYATLARSLGFRASWSSPILDGRQRLLGTLGLYSRQTGLPTPRQRKVIETAAHTASVAISRSQDEAALKLSDFSVNHASMPTLWVSRSGRLVRVNRATCELLGYSEPEMLGMLVTDLHPFFKPETWDEHWQETRERQKLTFESQQRRKDGSLILVEMNLNWFEFEGAEYHFVFFHDITARHQLEEGLRQSQKMDAIGQVSGGIAHDFNNLLTIIRGNLGMMRTSGPLPRNIVDCVDELEGAVIRATNFTGQLLAFGRKQVMRPEDLDLNRVVETFADLIRRVIVEAIVVELDLSPDALRVSADGSMLEQVMLNLCLNARDAMPKGGRIVLATSAVSVDAEGAERIPSGRRGAFARLAVTDSGTGISPENLAHVFEPFFTTKEVGKGTGLGLASVYGILQQHGGWVTVESEVGRGTTFAIYLPLTAGGAAVREAPAAEALGPAGGEMILLVEDNPDVRSTVNKALKLMGYRVLVAENGAEAGTLWARHGAEVDVLLTDVMLPGELGGLEVARSLLAQDPSLRVVFMSGYSADIAREDFDEARGEYFLSKPFELTDLASTLRRCIARQP